MTPGARTLTQSVTEELLRAIGAGEVRVGDRLPGEAELVARFGVGRNTLREALHALAALGVLDVRPRRGATVIAAAPVQPLGPDTMAVLLDDDAIDDLLELRELLEVELAGRAAERARSPDCKALRAALARCRSAAAEARSLREADLAFHRALARAAHDGISETVLDATAALLRRALDAMDAVPRHGPAVVVEHAAILTAVERHEPAAARTAMAGHMDTARATVAAARRLGAAAA